MGAVALIVAISAAGNSALRGSPENLTWIPYFVLTAILVIFRHRFLRQIFFSLFSFLHLGFWAYCYGANGGLIDVYEREGIIWLIPMPLVLICVIQLAWQVSSLTALLYKVRGGPN